LFFRVIACTSNIRVRSQEKREYFYIIEKRKCKEENRENAGLLIFSGRRRTGRMRKTTTLSKNRRWSRTTSAKAR
jgi:hypothetical protein